MWMKEKEAEKEYEYGLCVVGIEGNDAHFQAARREAPLRMKGVLPRNNNLTMQG